MKDWIDITMTISAGIMVYKNKAEKRPKLVVRANHEDNGYHESSIYMDLHTGTHIDMPLHMIPGGENSTHFDVGSVNGACVVVDFSKTSETAVDEAFLKAAATGVARGDIVLIKTKNSYAEGFENDYDYLAESGAAYLASLGVKAVGIDALGIERMQPGHPTHKTLLGAGIYIIEGLVLKAVEAGRYELFCLPLKIKNVEGLPARAFLKPETSA